ncbi:MAG TPA: PBP1A family penicillin-binding protein, partial [Myxococcales bacterium]|nr:PBP1A family penicillin-binding protein [Myxococcales bacterium]
MASPPLPASEQVSETLSLEGLPPPRRFLARAFLSACVFALSMTVLGAVAAFCLYVKYSEHIPSIPSAKDYRPPLLSELRSEDGRLLAEFFDERRKMMPYDQIPRRLVQAFVASEDKNFFDHHGFDVLATLRAAFQDAIGYHIRGASTLTQQTAKSILITAIGEKEATARKLSRKIKELILARRLEANLTKEEILYLYLNHVYLGHHAYGVRAAAENYFHKEPGQMSLAEMALIAGLPQAPSRYSPFSHPQAARKRRGYVLRRMADVGMITEAERAAADAEPIRVYPMEDLFHDRAPFFSEQVRRDVVARYGQERVLTGGLRIDTTLDLDDEHRAEEAMLTGLTHVDKRQGYFGPLEHLEPAQVSPFLDKIARQLRGQGLVEGRYYVGVVSKLAGNTAEIEIGNRTAELPLAGARWAHKPNPEAYFPSALIDRLGKAVHPGDVVLVRATSYATLTKDLDPAEKRSVPEKGNLVTLEQLPRLQGALVSLDPNDGYVKALIGGYDFDASEFNRSMQACRQPGSAFKPIVYSKAIDALNYNMSTILVDSPIVYDDPDTEKVWKPENYESDFKGDVPLRVALINSMNIPAIKVLQAVKPKEAAAWAHQLGITSKVNEDLSIALGSSCVSLWDLTKVYALFDKLGQRVRPFLVTKVTDRDGRVLEDHVALDDPWGSLEDRLAGGVAASLDPPEQVVDPTTAFLTTHLMQEVVQMGTGAEASRLGKPAAGKTGTTNDSFDAWFMGFTRDLVTGVWVGYDTYAMPLGKYENGGRA